MKDEIKFDGAALPQYTVDEKIILDDLEFFLQDVFAATFEIADKSLKIAFTNGQNFLLNVKEIK